MKGHVSGDDSAPLRRESRTPKWGQSDTVEAMIGAGPASGVMPGAPDDVLPGDADARHLALRLRELGPVKAPLTLLPAVLARVGLADRYATVASPLGLVFVAYGDEGITMVARAEWPEGFESAYRTRTGRPVQRVDETPRWLTRAFERWQEGAKPAVRFDLRRLTAFERAVLLKTQQIPRGEVRPYAWIAHEIGHPRAVRAVGSALAHNPIPLLIPCHRVVRSDGHIGQYSLGGADAKRTALLAEGVEPEVLERQARVGARFCGSDTTHVYCYPTCRQARRIGDGHRVAFSSEAAAAAAGYRPCRLCRPALSA